MDRNRRIVVDVLAGKIDRLEKANAALVSKKAIANGYMDHALPKALLPIFAGSTM